MNLPLFRLNQSSEELPELDNLIWEKPHEKAEGAFERCFQLNDGRLILTVWKQKLHEVIYQTPAQTDIEAAQRNTDLFNHYGEGFEWKEILDNGFGKTYRRADLNRYALWSYAMDFNTFGTMEFHSVKW